MTTAIRTGYLLHITHYDPVWVARKADEKPFDPAVGCEVIDAVARTGLNTLIVAFSDGMVYDSHPELARHYSVPKDVVAGVLAHARERGLDVIPKLNFAQSATHQHNHWFRPHHDLFDEPEYWRLAFEAIDELIAMVAPSEYFHVGMDEDHDRSYDQYVEAIDRLHAGLAERGLRPMIWNDSVCDWPRAAIHKAKSLYAETRIPTDVVQILWDYWDVRPQALQRLVDRGFEAWVAPGGDAGKAAGWRQTVEDVGAHGLLLTHWTPCIRDTRDKLIDRIETVGAALEGSK